MRAGITRSRSFGSAVACQGLLRRTSLDLVRTVSPAEKGIRLLGVTVSNFGRPESGGTEAMPLFDFARPIAS